DNNRAPALDDLYQLDWTAVGPAGTPDLSGWAVVGSAEAATRVGVQAVHPDLGALLDSSDGPTGTVALVLDTPPGVRLTAEVHEATTATLALLQRWLADERHAGARLVLVTTGAVSAVPSGHDLTGLAHSPLWGLVRSAQAEHHDRFVLVDVDGPDALSLVPAAVATGENQIAVRGDRLLVPRLARLSSTAALITPPDDATPWHVEAGADGSLDSLTVVATQR
ncbi:SpnB-like Rossmann fold domain-containing protein, partial [Micromonospora wenchangensis]|uniref:SpnB-like Rossmann fold domain-containing protein n=1 Tax=Micromonospora wenchangensis TaxID=1185415 RepID=UPI003D713BAA